MTFLTPSGVFIYSYLLERVPTIRFGFSGWMLSFLKRSTKVFPKKVLRLDTKYLVGWYGAGFATGFYYVSSIRDDTLND